MVLTVASVLVLLAHLADRACRGCGTAPLTAGTLLAMRAQLVVASAAAALVLVVATVLSLFKPAGVTPNRQRVTRRLRIRPA
jgi:hypothetical protein